MIDPTVLPIPDLGLRCWHCGAALAGLNEHRCAACGRRFNLLTLLAGHRPIPDMGLTCPTCDYPLTGLDSNRCPECGDEFSVAELLDDLQGGEDAPKAVVGGSDPPDHYEAKRKPTFTGRERPLPEFGLACSSCGKGLAGAAADACPACGEGFDLSSFMRGGDWVDIASLVPHVLVDSMRALLYEAQVSYVATTTVRHPYSSGVVTPLVLTPREFFFDALHVLAGARPAESGDCDRREWACPNCNEIVPANFDICWNCQTPQAEGGQ